MYHSFLIHSSADGHLGCFFEKINKIDKSFARLIKKNREKNQINKIRNENGEITTDNKGCTKDVQQTELYTYVHF